MKPWKAIAAMSLNRVIGADGKIPWHLPEDFRWFKQKTMGGILVMGRRTYESIGRPLPGRETIVISRAGATYPGTRTLTDLTQVETLDAGGKTVFIAGGGEIYQQAMDRCDEVFLTIVQRECAGDTFFPVFENGFPVVSEVLTNPDFRVMRYARNM